MKLEKFEEKNLKKKAIIISIGGIIFLLAGIYLYRTFAIFEENREFNIIKGQVPNQKYDVMLSYNIVDDSGNKTFQETIPEGRDWGVTIECDHGATGTWDYIEWGPDIRNLSDSRTKCSLNFKKLKVLVDLIKELPVVTSGDGLYEVSHDNAEITYTTDIIAIHNLKQTELRYAGANPNNYVRFNGELWQIIGLVNTPEGQRVKIIRQDSIGDYSWDSSADDVNSGIGVNEWSQADMMILLNIGAYWNRTSGTCYNERYNATTSCDFSSTGLTEAARNMIDTITWNLGSITTTALTPIEFYNEERSNQIGKECTGEYFCNDTVERTLTWSGKVGLMYISDYGYATSDRTCLSKTMDSSSTWPSSCSDNDWLRTSSQWGLSPNVYSDNASYVSVIGSAGNIGNHIAHNALSSRPNSYLKSSVKVVNGNGTLDSPYELIL